MPFEITPILLITFGILVGLIGGALVPSMFRKNPLYELFDSGNLQQITEALARYSRSRMTQLEFTSTLQSQLRLCSNRINELHSEEVLLKDLISSGFNDERNLERVKSLSNDLIVVKAKIKREVAWRKILKTQYLYLLAEEKSDDSIYF